MVDKKKEELDRIEAETREMMRNLSIIRNPAVDDVLRKKALEIIERDLRDQAEKEQILRHVIEISDQNLKSIGTQAMSAADLLEKIGQYAKAESEKLKRAGYKSKNK